jgi:hypothetical protein
MLIDIFFLSPPNPGRVVDIVYGNGDGTFHSSYTPNAAPEVPGTTGATAIGSSDVNGDSNVDLIATLSGVPTTFYGDGAGNFSTTAP